jgi:hypothetical protein
VPGCFQEPDMLSRLRIEHLFSFVCHKTYLNC